MKQASLLVVSTLILSCLFVQDGFACTSLKRDISMARIKRDHDEAKRLQRLYFQLRTGKISMAECRREQKRHADFKETNEIDQLVKEAFEEYDRDKREFSRNARRAKEQSRDHRVVVGTNDPIANRMGRLQVYFSRDYLKKIKSQKIKKSAQCSAQLIAENLLVTAKHCLHVPGHEVDLSVINRIVFIPEKRRTEPQFAVRVWSRNDSRGSKAYIKNDLAFIELADRSEYIKGSAYRFIGDKTGWFAVGLNHSMNSSKVSGVHYGYPGDKDKTAGTLYKSEITVQDSSKRSGILSGIFMSYHGQSGGGFFIFDERENDYLLRGVLQGGGNETVSSVFGRVSYEENHFAAIDDMAADMIRAIFKDGSRAQSRGFTRHELGKKPHVEFRLNHDCGESMYVAIRYRDEFGNWKQHGWQEAHHRQDMILRTSLNEVYFFATNRDMNKMIRGNHSKRFDGTINQKVPLKKISIEEFSDSRKTVSCKRY